MTFHLVVYSLFVLSCIINSYFNFKYKNKPAAVAYIGSMIAWICCIYLTMMIK